MKHILLAGLVSLSLVSAVEAGLIGDTVDSELLRFGVNLGGPDSVVVMPGPEGNWFDQIQYDIENESITVSSLLAFTGSTTWTSDLAFSFTDLDWINPGPGQIVGVNVINATGDGWSLIDNSDVSFTSDSVLIDASKIDNTQVALDQSITVELITIHAVPEPSTFALLGIGGLALVGYGWRRKRQHTT